MKTETLDKQKIKELNKQLKKAKTILEMDSTERNDLLKYIKAKNRRGADSGLRNFMEMYNKSEFYKKTRNPINNPDEYM